MIKGQVIKSTGSQYLVKLQDNSILTCRIRGKLRKMDIVSTNPVAVGDNVMLERQDDNSAWIIDIEDRKNYIIRKSTKLSKQCHIIAANVDKAFIIFTIAVPDTPLEFLDRFLVSAEAYNVKVCIVFNKIDLYVEEHLEYIAYLIDIYREIGYECMPVSAKTNENIDVLKSLLVPGLNLFSGVSGAGKSTILNTLKPELNLKTQEISNYHLKGKHTTSFAEIFQLYDNYYVIDTPGIKGFGLYNFEKNEIYHFFPEIFKYSHKCKYHNCLHINEPGCEVIKAVESGQIAESRYRSYLNIYYDDNSKHRT
ncbi:MAG: ribosome small subunit-dependent GTPase A [Marinilabiliales bacterium]